MVGLKVNIKTENRAKENMKMNEASSQNISTFGFFHIKGTL